jgi:nitrogen regulatory protein PII
MSGQQYERIVFVMTIVSRGRGDAVIEMLRSKGIPYNIASIGYTAIGLELADYFGLTEVKRDIILSIVPEYRVPETMTMLEYGFSLNEKHMGIAFCVPVSGVSGLKALQYISGSGDVFRQRTPVAGNDASDSERRKDDHIMKRDYESAEYRLIITVVGRGHADVVMDAAKAAGARGGTVMYARGSGVHETEKFLNIPIEPEKEIVLTLVKKSAAKDITLAITKKAGLDQEGRGISFSLPVTDVSGIVTEDY